MRKYLERMYAGAGEEFRALLKEDLDRGGKRFIITANPEILVMSEKDRLIEEMLLNGDCCIVPDGIAVVKACTMLNVPVTERITGVDTAWWLLEELNSRCGSLYLLGATEQVIGLMEKKIGSDYPNIRLMGRTDGYVSDKDAVFDEIAELKPDVCMVALGVPAQEKLIYKHLSRFEKGIFIGVGGSFDVISGAKERAPEFFIRRNLEWLYRIMKEPKRIKRFYDNNVRFLLKIRKYR